MNVSYSAAARKDLKQIRSYIAEKSYRSRADDYIRRILSYCDSLSTFPERGTAHSEIKPNLRSIGFEHRATIIFTVWKDEVIIEGVFYGGRQWQERFIGEE